MIVVAGAARPLARTLKLASERIQTRIKAEVGQQTPRPELGSSVFSVNTW